MCAKALAASKNITSKEAQGCILHGFQQEALISCWWFHLLPIYYISFVDKGVRSLPGVVCRIVVEWHIPKGMVDVNIGCFFHLLRTTPAFYGRHASFLHGGTGVREKISSREGANQVKNIFITMNSTQDYNAIEIIYHSPIINCLQQEPVGRYKRTCLEYQISWLKFTS